MKDEIQKYSFQGDELKVKEINGSIWFNAEQAAKGLGFVQEKQGQTYVRWERIKKYLNSPQVGKDSWISEPEFYQLAIKADNEKARRFQRWVTHDVLPTIRKHGAYMTNEKIEEILLNPDTIIQLATELKDERTGRLIAEQQVHELKPKATYYDKVLQSKGLVPITLIAKDYGMSGSAMNNLLHELKVIYKMGGTWLLYSPYQSLGWTSSQTFVVDKPDGTQKTIMQTKWTQQGRLGLYELLKSKKGLVPVIERSNAKKQPSLFVRQGEKNGQPN